MINMVDLISIFFKKKPEGTLEGIYRQKETYQFSRHCEFVNNLESFGKINALG